MVLLRVDSLCELWYDMSVITPHRNYYWAKTTAEGLPGCEVWQHSVAAAEVARCLLLSRPDLVSMLPDGVVALVGVHDVGKISPGFQTKCPMWKGPDGETDAATLSRWALIYDGNHAYMSKCIVWHYYKEYKKSRLGRHWSYYVGAHHGTPQEDYKPLNETELPSDWMDDCVSLVQYIESKYGPLPDASKQPESVKRVICGFMTVADWIASNELCFPVDRKSVDYDKLAKASLGMIGLEHVPAVNKGVQWKKLFRHCVNPHPLQKYMWDLKPEHGVYVVEDSMGGGKTEAALAFSYHMIESGRANGIYFALPTQTTSNRIFTRVRDFLRNCGLQVNEQSMQLAHGNSWLMRDSLYENKEGLEFVCNGQFNELKHWFSSSKRTLLAPFGVGTIDQALMGVVAVKHRDVRVFALAGKVVILDEVHSYDFYTGTLLTSLVNQLRESGATVVILSATLTRSRTAELLGCDIAELQEKGYPLVTSKVGNRLVSKAFGYGSSKSIKLHIAELSIVDQAQLAYEHAMRGECVLWVCNTVVAAQTAYNTLKSEACEGGPVIGLLHARFPYWRREELEKQWIDSLGKDTVNRPHGCVLVATQIVEQSVDIDADFLITELAPVDMILQRVGRLWRHSRAVRPCEEPEVLVSVPPGVESAIDSDNYNDYLVALGANAKVYSSFVLWRTLLVLKNYELLHLPVDIRPLVENVYAEDIDVSYSNIARESMKILKREAEKMQIVAKLNQASSAGVGKDCEGVYTRYGDVPSLDVLLLKEKPRNISAVDCEYAPLFGDNFVVSPREWKFDVAKSININTVRVPAWLLGEIKPADSLEKYGMNGIYPFFVLENGDLKYYTGECSGLAWNDHVGIISKPRSYNEEKSEFMY